MSYSLDELFNLLPAYINDSEYIWDLVIKKCPYEYEVKYCNEDVTKCLFIEWDKDLSIALNKLHNYLLKNKFI